MTTLHPIHRLALALSVIWLLLATAQAALPDRLELSDGWLLQSSRQIDAAPEVHCRRACRHSLPPSNDAALLHIPPPTIPARFAPVDCLRPSLSPIGSSRQRGIPTYES
ncbi:MAG: hypothetical protein IPP19_00620 [Verrucomicrobia bacterium]|nr:hypothetical protein [Verrucomicrobiota bacterium]